LFAHVLELANELGVVERYTGHLGSLEPSCALVSLRGVPTAPAGPQTDPPPSEEMKRGLGVGATSAMRPSSDIVACQTTAAIALPSSRRRSLPRKRFVLER